MALTQTTPQQAPAVHTARPAPSRAKSVKLQSFTNILNLAFDGGLPTPQKSLAFQGRRPSELNVLSCPTSRSSSRAPSMYGDLAESDNKFTSKVKDTIKVTTSIRTNAASPSDLLSPPRPLLALTPRPSLDPTLSSRSRSLFGRKPQASLAKVPESTVINPTPALQKPKADSKMRLFGIGKGASPTKPEINATVLRAVPASSTRHQDTKTSVLAPLDEAIVTSPNAEILTAIGQSQPEDGSGYVSPLSPYHKSQTEPEAQKSRKIQKSSTATDHEFLGTWKDGEVTWASSQATNEVSIPSLSSHHSRHPSNEAIEITMFAPDLVTPLKPASIPPYIETKPLPQLPEFQPSIIPKASSQDQISRDLQHSVDTHVTKKPDIKLQIPKQAADPLTSSQSSIVHLSPTTAQPTPSPRLPRTPRLTREEVQNMILPLAHMARPQHPLELAALTEEDNPAPELSPGVSSFSGEDRDEDYVSLLSNPASPNFMVANPEIPAETFFSKTSTVPDFPLPDAKISKNGNATLAQNNATSDGVAYTSLRTTRRRSAVPVEHINQNPQLGSTGDKSIVPSQRDSNAVPTQSSEHRLSAICETISITPELPARSYRRGADYTAKYYSIIQSSRWVDDCERAQNIAATAHPRVNMRDCAALISPMSAEIVIQKIMQKLDSLPALFSCAQINRGFYSVFKRNELKLMKCVLRSSSPAAWEHRETSFKEIISTSKTRSVEYTPTTYYQLHMRDMCILRALRSVILVRCQSFLRPETILALRGRDSTRSRQIDDALWRIWSFCDIFGSGKVGEDDVKAQSDWLRGGVLAQQSEGKNGQPGRPASFGRGNGVGLTADELWDLTEMWNCLSALLSGIQGQDRVAQAEANGVFSDSKVKGEHKSVESDMLDEWIYYLMTLGLNVVCDLASSANFKSASVFEIAREMGWTRWTAPQKGLTRASFFREAVSQVYQEKVSGSLTPTTEKIRVEAELKRRNRSSKIAQMLRDRKKNIDLAGVPISDDRPMSGLIDTNGTFRTTIHTISTQLPRGPSASYSLFPSTAPKLSPKKSREALRKRSQPMHQAYLENSVSVAISQSSENTTSRSLSQRSKNSTHSHMTSSSSVYSLPKQPMPTLHSGGLPKNRIGAATYREDAKNGNSLEGTVDLFMQMKVSAE